MTRLYSIKIIPAYILCLLMLSSCTAKPTHSKYYDIYYYVHNDATATKTILDPGSVNWTPSTDFSFLDAHRDFRQIFIKVIFKKKRSDHYFYIEQNTNHVDLHINSQRYWSLPSRNIFFSTHNVPLLIPSDELLITITRENSWSHSGMRMMIHKFETIQNFIFHSYLLRTTLGSIFLILGTMLWGLIFVRPKDAIAIISFEFFLILIGLFCIGSSSIIQSIFAFDTIWPLLSALTILLVPVPLLIHCASIVREHIHKWNIALYSVAAMIVIGILPIFYNYFFMNSGYLFNMMAPVLIIFGMGTILILSLSLIFYSRASSRLHGWGLLFFCMLFGFDIINYSLNLNLLSDLLCPYGTLFLTLSIFVILENRFSRAQRDLEKSLVYMKETNKSYNRFIPKEFFEFLNIKEITDVNLGNNIEYDFTIMVSDIHQFTALSEKMTPSENFDFVNSYFNRIVPSITGNHGFIVKYMGDGIMALFSKSSGDAVKCALDIQNILYVYNQSRITRNRVPIKTGIGIHKGTARLGIIGSEKRMQGDIISDTANMAARVEGLTRIYGASTVISESAITDIGPGSLWKFRTLDRVIMKGKSQPLTVFELLPPNQDGSQNLKIQTLDMFNNAIDLYLNKEFAGAAEIMQEIIKINPDDTAASRYIDSAMFYAINGAPEDWKGITQLDRKN